MATKVQPSVVRATVCVVAVVELVAPEVGEGEALALALAEHSEDTTCPGPALAEWTPDRPEAPPQPAIATTSAAAGNLRHAKSAMRTAVIIAAGSLGRKFSARSAIVASMLAWLAPVGIDWVNGAHK